MRQEMFDDKSPEDREIMLRDTCDKVERFSYEKAYTNQDVDLFREQLSDIMIKLSKIDHELAAVKKEFGVKTKPLRAEVKQLLENINFRSQTVDEQVYIYIDHEDNQVGYYNATGMLVHTRQLKIDEHQRSIMGASREHDESWAETIDEN